MSYTIGEISKKFDISIHTLRYYEKEGLLPPVQRTTSGIRRYDDMAVGGLLFVECLKTTNMPLKEIKNFLDWCKEGDSTLTKRKEMFYERREVVLKQIEDLKNVLKMIDYKCLYYETAERLGSEDFVRGKCKEDITAMGKDDAKRGSAKSMGAKHGTKRPKSGSKPTLRSGVAALGNR